jgi:hypothetical protein
MNCPVCNKLLKVNQADAALIEAHRPEPGSRYDNEPVCEASNMPHPDLLLEQEIRVGVSYGKYDRKPKIVHHEPKELLDLKE